MLLLKGLNNSTSAPSSLLFISLAHFNACQHVSNLERNEVYRVSVEECIVPSIPPRRCVASLPSEGDRD